MTTSGVVVGEELLSRGESDSSSRCSFRNDTSFLWASGAEGGVAGEPSPAGEEADAACEILPPSSQGSLFIVVPGASFVELF